MTGEARLGLAEDGHQLADVEGAPRREGQNAEPGRFGDGPERQEKIVHTL
jgi:hypothetical protein